MCGTGQVLWLSINKTLNKDKPPTPLQGHAEFWKKNLQTIRLVFFFQKPCNSATAHAFWLLKV
jgi:hypothetical protein